MSWAIFAIFRQKERILCIFRRLYVSNKINKVAYKFYSIPTNITKYDVTLAKKGGFRKSETVLQSVNSFLTGNY